MVFKELAENTGLDEDEFLEMVELFLEVGSSDLNKLQSAIDEENVQEVIEAAHSIKGASGNMGFMEIFEVAKGVEVKAREDSLDGAAEAVKSIKEKLDLIAETLR
ncbi:MAG: Hpt domain-containing protein [Deltaproteobacteria bacterium]|nr:Hpt domain-containing protein [Deltaproteobacteria bacterium]